MILSIRKYLTTSYISLAIIDNKFQIYVNVYKHNKLIRHFFKEFSNKQKAIKYIEEITQETYFYYLAVFFTSVGQGALPDTSAKTLEKYHVSKTNVSIVSLKFLHLYAINQELSKYITIFNDAEFDVDFIFSPFAILFYQLRHLELFASSKNVFYALKHKNYIAFLIMRDKKLLFSSFFYTSRDSVGISSIDASQSEYIRSDIEQIVEQKQQEEEENLLGDDIFKDINDISDIDKIDEIVQDATNETPEDLNSFSGDMQLYDYIKSALDEYYSNELYESDFIDELVIYTSDKISKSVLKMIEDELLLAPHVFNIDIYEQMNNMMRDSL